MKKISLCANCPYKNNPKYINDCVECKNSNMNHTEVFAKNERSNAKILKEQIIK